MRKLVITLIIGAVVLGIGIAGYDCTYALFLAVMFSPEIFQKKRYRNTARKHVQGKLGGDL